MQERGEIKTNVAKQVILWQSILGGYDMTKYFILLLVVAGAGFPQEKRQSLDISCDPAVDAKVVGFCSDFKIFVESRWVGDREHWKIIVNVREIKKKSRLARMVSTNDNASYIHVHLGFSGEYTIASYGFYIQIKNGDKPVELAKPLFSALSEKAASHRRLMDRVAGL